MSNLSQLTLLKEYSSLYSKIGLPPLAPGTQCRNTVLAKEYMFREGGEGGPGSSVKRLSFSKPNPLELFAETDTEYWALASRE